MAASLPLFARLSHAYTAFTVACDNGVELRVPHRTTGHGGTHGAPWLVSSSLWFRYLRHIPVDGAITLRDLKQMAALPTNEFKMWTTRFESWWGYIYTDAATKTIRATPGGRVALLAFPQVLAETEAAWHERFPQLRKPFALIAETLEAETPLPPSLSTLNHGLFSAPGDEARSAPCENMLPVLLAKVLNAFAFDYERETFLALPVSANILRVIPSQGIAARDVPRLSGIASAACTNATKLLLKSGAVRPYVTSEFAGKALRRTERGDELNGSFEGTIKTIEARWRRQYGAGLLRDLSVALPDHEELLLMMRPQPGNWRAAIPATRHLPWFPMILHRGGFPDGS